MESSNVVALNVVVLKMWYRKYVFYHNIGRGGRWGEGKFRFNKKYIVCFFQYMTL